MTAPKNKQTPASQASVPATPTARLKIRKSFSGILTEPTTYAGIALIAGAIATGGLAGLLAAPNMAQLISGIALVLTKGAKEEV